MCIFVLTYRNLIFTLPSFTGLITLVYLLEPIFHCHLELLDMVNDSVDIRRGTVEQSTSATSTSAHSL